MTSRVGSTDGDPKPGSTEESQIGEIVLIESGHRCYLWRFHDVIREELNYEDRLNSMSEDVFFYLLTNHFYSLPASFNLDPVLFPSWFHFVSVTFLSLPITLSCVLSSASKT